MAKEQTPKRSIADLLASPPAQPEARPLSESEIDATTRKIHYNPPPSPVAVQEPSIQNTAGLSNPTARPAQPRKIEADDALTRISFDVTISMFVQMKEKALRNHQTMRAYLTQLVEKDLGLS